MPHLSQTSSENPRNKILLALPKRTTALKIPSPVSFRAVICPTERLLLQWPAQDWLLLRTLPTPLSTAGVIRIQRLSTNTSDSKNRVRRSLSSPDQARLGNIYKELKSKFLRESHRKIIKNSWLEKQRPLAYVSYMAQYCMTQRNATENTQEEWKRHPGAPSALLTAVPLADRAPLAPSSWSQAQSLFCLAVL